MPRKASSSSRTKASAPVEPPAPIRREPLFSRPPVILAILGTMIVCAVYLWVVQPHSSAPLSGDRMQEKGNGLETVSGLISRVSGLIVVKTDETPTVYSVTDAAAFTEAWPAAAEVKEGDKVLEWSDKTVIYSPSEDKIVAVLPAFDQITHMPEAAEPEEGVTVEIRNGSGIAGAAARLQRDLRDQGFHISLIGDARTRLNEGGTILIDFTNGGAPNALALLREATSGTVATLPDTEPLSDDDILILIGNE